MNGRLKIFLKANERIFINGAVLRVDRKVSLELMNDVVFLLENHVMQEEDANTPLRQLYFIVQSMLIEPSTRELARKLYDAAHKVLIATYKDQGLLEGLGQVRDAIDRDKAFEALKRIRAMFDDEALILNPSEPTGDKAVA